MTLVLLLSPGRLSDECSFFIYGGGEEREGGWKEEGETRKEGSGGGEVGALKSWEDVSKKVFFTSCVSRGCIFYYSGVLADWLKL